MGPLLGDRDGPAKLGVLEGVMLPPKKGDMQRHNTALVSLQSELSRPSAG